MKAVIVCGARRIIESDWHDAVCPAIGYDHNITVIDGCCGCDADGFDIQDMKGVDWLAYKHVSAIQATVLPMPAPWKRMGDGAGPFRNMQMLSVLMALGHCGYEIAVLAFHNDLIGGSKGSKNMVARAKLAGVPYAVYDSTGHAYLEGTG